jgi:radical SAM superfamily enzyme YgiQ (UPF0313 family)
MFSLVASDFLKDLAFGFYPPLGLLYVAAAVETHSSHRVEVLDAEVERMDYRALEREIRERAPDLVGIYTSSVALSMAYRVAKLVKGIKKEILVVAGGPHVQIYPRESAALPEIDYVILGEGEETVVRLLNCLEQGTDPACLDGIAFEREGEIFVSPQINWIKDLDALSFPARHLTHFDKYHSLIGKGNISTTLMASRGCPFRCTFCYLPFNGKLRFRSVGNVVDEIQECVRMGIREFFFFDEVFTINKERVKAICQEIVDRKLDIIFDVRSRVDTVDEEVIRYLKKAGCSRIQFGVESASPEILKRMNKNITLEQVYRAFKLAKKYRLTTLADFMLGYPGETKEQMQETMRLAKRLNPDFVQYAITAFYPATKIYHDAVKHGMIEDFWQTIAEHPYQDASIPIASDLYSREELVEILTQAYNSFYLRPRYIWQRLKKINTWKEFKRQAKAGFQMFWYKLQSMFSSTWALFYKPR